MPVNVEITPGSRIHINLAVGKKILLALQAVMEHNPNYVRALKFLLMRGEKDQVVAEEMFHNIQQHCGRSAEVLFDDKRQMRPSVKLFVEHCITAGVCQRVKITCPPELWPESSASATPKR